MTAIVVGYSGGCTSADRNSRACARVKGASAAASAALLRIRWIDMVCPPPFLMMRAELRLGDSLHAGTKRENRARVGLRCKVLGPRGANRRHIAGIESGPAAGA